MPGNLGADRAADFEPSVSNNNNFGNSDSDRDKRDAEKARTQTSTQRLAESPTKTEQTISNPTALERATSSSVLDSISYPSNFTSPFTEPVTPQEVQDYLVVHEAAEQYSVPYAEEACMASCHGNLPPDPNRRDGTAEVTAIAEGAIGLTGLGGAALGARNFIMNPSLGTLGNAALGLIPGKRGVDAVSDLAKVDTITQGTTSVSRGRSGTQPRLREIMNDPNASSADRGWLRNDARHIEFGNKSSLRIPRNGRESPGRKMEDKGYELAHPYDAPASEGNSYAGSKLKNYADHKVETRLHRAAGRY